MTSPIPFEAIGDALRADRPLSPEAAAALSESCDLVHLGMLADERRRAVRGERVTFVRVAEVSARNGGGSLSVPPRAGEVRLVDCPETFDALLVAVRRAADAAEGVPVTGWGLDELVTLCRGDAAAFDSAAAALRDAGLSRIAEASLDRTLDPVWLLRAAAAELPVARLTVHDPNAGGVAAIRRVAGWGRDAAVRAFAPLPRLLPGKPSTGYEDVRQVALARLLVDNIASIQVDWRLYGPQLAQVALTFGADDIDGVLPVDSLELGPRRAPLEEIRRNIRAAGLEPRERDGCFELLGAEDDECDSAGRG